MASIQTALLDFRREFNFTSQESPDLIINYEDRSIKIHFRNPEDAYPRDLEDRAEELDLHPVQQIGCFRSFCRRFGISYFFRSLYNGLTSCCCNRGSLEKDYYPSTELDGNAGHHSRERRTTRPSITAQDKPLPKPSSSPSMREPNISHRSKSHSYDPLSISRGDIGEMHESLLE